MPRFRVMLKWKRGWPPPPRAAATKRKHNTQQKKPEGGGSAAHMRARTRQKGRKDTRGETRLGPRGEKKRALQHAASKTHYGRRKTESETAGSTHDLDPYLDLDLGSFRSQRAQRAQLFENARRRREQALGAAVGAGRLQHRHVDLDGRLAGARGVEVRFG